MARGEEEFEKKTDLGGVVSGREGPGDADKDKEGGQDVMDPPKTWIFDILRTIIGTRSTEPNPDFACTVAGGLLLYTRTRKLNHLPTLMSLVCGGSNLTKFGFWRLHETKTTVSYSSYLKVRKGIAPDPHRKIDKWKHDVEAWLLRKANGELTEEDYVPHLRR